MNKAKRSAVIAGNWKMNMTPAETTDFMKALAPKVADVKEAKVLENDTLMTKVELTPVTSSEKIQVEEGVTLNR